MENIIQKIIDIDQRAQQKYIDAQQHRDEVKAETQRMDAETRKNSEIKLANLRLSENEQLEDIKKTIAADLAEKKSALEQIYQQNHLKWEQELFQKVLQEERI